jgi:ABC-type lipoprotein export system ATPase subunit
LWLLAGLIRPTAGVVEVYGQDLRRASNRDQTWMRRRDIGVVLQNPGRNLIPYATAVENLLFAQRSTRRGHRAQVHRAQTLLETVGLTPAARRPAGRLSGGEQQRLAVAVALANGPHLLLADEPTSQLDRISAGWVIDLIRATNDQFGTTVVAVTHDPSVGAALGRTVTIRDGRVGAEGRGDEEYVVVGRDGSVQLPDDLLEVLPPGSLAQARRTGDGIELRRYDPSRGSEGRPT